MEKYLDMGVWDLLNPNFIVLQAKARHETVRFRPNSLKINHKA